MRSLTSFSIGLFFVNIERIWLDKDLSTVAPPYKDSRCKEYLLKRNNFEIRVVACTVLGAHGYKEHEMYGTV